MATLSMGVRNAAKPLIAGRPVRTFMTGTMIDCGEALAAGALASGPAGRERLHHAGILSGVWATSLAGGAVAGLAALRPGTSAAILPAAGVLAALAPEWRAHRARRPPGLPPRVTIR